MPKHKLFILEDDVVTAEMYYHYFSNDFQVEIAKNVEEFHGYFKKHLPDIAIIDINIRDPKYDGEMLVSDLKTQRDDVKTKFIAVTGYQELRSSEIFHAHYAKPIDLDQLSQFIHTQLTLEDPR